MGRASFRQSTFLAFTLASVLLTTSSCHPLVEHLDKTRLNPVAGPSGVVRPDIRKLHDQLFIADAHADTLLWDRNGMENENDYGHIDLPRLLEANVSFQVLTIVSRSPAFLFPKDRCPPFLDQLILVASLQGWPLRTWFSPRQRAFHQADKWEKFCHHPQVVPILTREDLDEFRAARGVGFVPLKERKVATLLGVEGAHALDIQPNSSSDVVDREVRAFAKRGVRLMGLTHRFDNALGCSSEGCVECRSSSGTSQAGSVPPDSGLTTAGMHLVAALNRHSILIDLAHASPTAVDEILELTTKPPIVSHTGVKGIVDSHRNLGDKHLVAVARKGGVICIGFWPKAVGGEPTVVDIVNSIDYTVALLDKNGFDGSRHVGLGSDFDGAVKTAFDVRGLPQITGELKRRGYTLSQIRRIMGENEARVVRDNLPGRN